MTQLLKEFLIVIDGKPFIKCKNPKIRADFKWEKFKCTRYGMCLTKENTEKLTDEICVAIEQDGFADLTPAQRRAIIWGINTAYMC